MSWEMEYSRKLQTADQALQFLKSGMRVYIHPGCAEPETLVEAMMRRARTARGRDHAYAHDGAGALLRPGNARPLPSQRGVHRPECSGCN